jgi:hypothetical protein
MANSSSESVIRAVRLAVCGKIALFICNRNDRRLERKLETELGLEVDWCVLGPRRMRSAAHKVRAGHYDLVIIATGFVGHSVEHVIGKAAKSVGVPIVRAGRGRLWATAEALYRSTRTKDEHGEGR